VVLRKIFKHFLGFLGLVWLELLLMVLGGLVGRF